MATRTPVPKFTPCLGYDGNAEEAARFYCGLFPNSKVMSVQRAPADYPGGKKDQALVVEFSLSGQRFVGLNGGAYFKFNEAVSFMVDVSTQAEYDQLTAALSAVPEAEQCGWIKDRYGLSWQLVPRQLMDLLGDKDPKVAKAAFASMMEMKRIDIAELVRAARDARGLGSRPGKAAPAAPQANRKPKPAAKPVPRPGGKGASAKPEARQAAARGSRRAR